MTQDADDETFQTTFAADDQVAHVMSQATANEILQAMPENENLNRSNDMVNMDKEWLFQCRQEYKEYYDVEQHEHVRTCPEPVQQQVILSPEPPQQEFVRVQPPEPPQQKFVRLQLPEPPQQEFVFVQPPEPPQQQHVFIPSQPVQEQVFFQPEPPQQSLCFCNVKYACVQQVYVFVQPPEQKQPRLQMPEVVFPS
nr:gamma-gliadin-like [Parasteatoda tepidariorum]